ncbi:heme exporter protein CcmD [soil metagenome]
MMALGPYAGFIILSYLLVAAVVVILIVWIDLEYRRVRAQLRALEESGISRRSGRSATDMS